MEGDLEEMAHLCASTLMSDDVEDIDKGIHLIGKTYMVDGREEGFARIAQEIAMYKGGAVLKKLWKGTQEETPGLEQATTGRSKFSTGCSLAFSMLSSSKVVVERSLTIFGTKERQTAREVYRILSEMAVEEARSLKRGDNVSGLSDSMVTLGAPIQSLVNFAEASRVFREAMKDVGDEHALYETFGYLVSDELLTRFPAVFSSKVRSLFARLAYSLASSVDSQLWALNKGILRLIAAIYESSPIQEFTFGANSKKDVSPIEHCTFALVHFLENEATAEMMRAHNALSGFKPHKRKINATRPRNTHWKYVKGRLQGRQAPVGLQRHTKAWKVRNGWDGCAVPTVCSWKLCKAGPETPPRKFGKCALCQVARYCSKEHQSLHWRTHKIHCQSPDARHLHP